MEVNVFITRGFIIFYYCAVIDIIQTYYLIFTVAVVNLSRNVIIWQKIGSRRICIITEEVNSSGFIRIPTLLLGILSTPVNIMRLRTAVDAEWFGSWYRLSYIRKADLICDLFTQWLDKLMDRNVPEVFKTN